MVRKEPAALGATAGLGLVGHGHAASNERLDAGSIADGSRVWVNQSVPVAYL